MASSSSGEKPKAEADTSFSFRNFSPSGLIGRNRVEVKLFNNLYTQTAFFESSGDRKDDSQRRSWFTSLLRIQYGISARTELGLDVNYRRVRYGFSDESAILIFANDKDTVQRAGLSKLGLNMRWQPFTGFSNLSLRLGLLSSILRKDQLPDSGPFLDSDASHAYLEFLLDYYPVSDIWIYTSITSNLEIPRETDQDMIFRTPVSLIGSYRRMELINPYVMAEFNPTWSDKGFSSQYMQAGIGIKIVPRDDLELEVLYSNFLFGKNAGAGQTYNLGLRRVF